MTPKLPREAGRPDLPEPGAVLAAVKDAARRARARWPAKRRAILDRGSARRPGRGRPGRGNGPQPNQETGLAKPPSRTDHALPRADIFTRYRQTFFLVVEFTEPCWLIPSPPSAGPSNTGDRIPKAPDRSQAPPPSFVPARVAEAVPAAVVGPSISPADRLRHAPPVPPRRGHPQPRPGNPDQHATPRPPYSVRHRQDLRRRDPVARHHQPRQRVIDEIEQSKPGPGIMMHGSNHRC